MTPSHVVVPAIKVGHGLWGQMQRRSAVLAALTDGAYDYADQLGASHSEAVEFSRCVRQCLRAAGTRPKGLKARAAARFRGGPATIFDGPEARHWKDRVTDLGRRALAEFNRAHPGSGWTTRATDATPSYYDSVLASAQSAGDDYRPSLAIVNEQDQVDRMLRERAHRTPTRVRIAKVVVATALGAALGHYADVQSGDVPDWMETGIVATVAAAAGTRVTGQSSDQEAAAEISAAAAENITYSRRRLRTGLREVVNGLVEIVSPSLRGPPLAYQQPLTGTVEAGLVLVADKAKDKAKSESSLFITGRQRETLAAAMDRLRREADAAGLDELDPVCDEAITNLQRAIEMLTGAPVQDYEVQLKLGVEFVNALLLGWLVASRLEVTPAPSAKQLPQITDPPALKVAA